MKNIYFLILATAFMLSPNFVSAQGETCASSIQMTAGTNSFTGSQNTDQWFNFTATQTGKITITSCSLTSEDTYVKVYAGGICIPLTLKAESDDHCSTQSKVSFIGTFDVVEDFGYDYFIVWQNKSSSASFDWTIVEEPLAQGEICSDPTLAVEGSTNLCNHEACTDQWFSYTPTENGKIKVSSCALATENTSVRIFDSCSGIQLSANDDFRGTQSEVEFDALMNQEYLIQWEKNAISGSYNWSLTFEGTATNIGKSDVTELKLNINSGVLNIFRLVDESLDVKLYNISGALVSKQSKYIVGEDIDCTELTQGIYILRLMADSGIYTKKDTH